MDTLAENSSKNIYGLFTEQEVQMLEDYMGAELGGKFDGPSEQNDIILINDNIIFKENLFTIEDKIDNISGKIIVNFIPNNLTYKIKMGNLTIQEGEIDPNVYWKIDNPILNAGLNHLELEAIDSNSNVLKKEFVIANLNSDNSNGLVLDKNDDDKDGLLNYIEDMLLSDKNNPDTDKDGYDDKIDPYPLKPPIKINEWRNVMGTIPDEYTFVRGKETNIFYPTSSFEEPEIYYEAKIDVIESNTLHATRKNEIDKADYINYFYAYYWFTFLSKDEAFPHYSDIYTMFSDINGLEYYTLLLEIFWADWTYNVSLDV